MSPYQIVFGDRSRIIGGTRTPSPQECQDARYWVIHHQRLDELVASKVDQINQPLAVCLTSGGLERRDNVRDERAFVLRPKVEKRHS